MLGFLHTLSSNVDKFGTLLAQMDGSIQARHLVDEKALADARAAGGVTDAVRRRVEEAVGGLASGGARVVVCTCSTIAAAAEAAPVPAGVVVMRIDRPMAERAIAHGPRVRVAAALASTFAPTVALLRETARRASVPLEVSELLCEGAWPLFERGDLTGYERAIAQAIEQSTGEVDVVVLAQASMAGAAAFLPGWRTPVLSSPRLGLEAALRQYHGGAATSSS